MINIADLKKIESIFSNENYDRKNKVNRSYKIVPESLIDCISTNGITTEILLESKLPVFHYKTQITIHGFFPESVEQRIAGYKSLVLNKNKSIGVKYRAVDVGKKIRIFKLLKLEGWHVSSSSTELFAYKISGDYTDNYKGLLEESSKAKKWCETRNHNLFIGSIKSHVMRNRWTNSIYVATIIDIKSILESNVIDFVNNVTDFGYETLNTKRLIAEAQERIRIRQQKRKRESEIRERELLRSVNTDYLEETYGKISKIKKPTNDVYVSIAYSGAIAVRFITTKPRQKLIRYVWRTYETIGEFQDNHLEFVNRMRNGIFTYSDLEQKCASFNGVAI